MKTAVLTSGIITAILLAGILTAHAEPSVYAREQDLITGVTPAQEEQERPNFFRRLFQRSERPPREELPPIPREIGEKEGFWTQVRNAFDYNVQPVTENTNELMERNAMMVEGRELYRRGEYAAALETFKEVIQRDPYNITARRYIRTCQERLMRITMDDFDIVRRERLQEVERTWLLRPPAEREVERIIGERPRAERRRIDEHIQQIIPSVRYTDADIAVVIENLAAITDPRISIVTDPGAFDTLRQNDQDTITLHLTQVPFINIIRYICRTKGLVYRVDDNAIVISDRESVRMRRRVFQLSRSLDMIEGLDVDDRRPTARAVALFRRLGISPVDTDGATVTYDARNNRLIVNNTDANLQIIGEFIERFSETPLQVQIEARFVTVRNDEMSQLVFRHFLTKDYRWDHQSYGDRYYLTAPNQQRELTPGLRYIRSFMDEQSFDPLGSAYTTPRFTTTGDQYSDYLRTLSLRPHGPGLGQPTLANVENQYQALRQQRAQLERQQENARARYAAYQNFYSQAAPIIARGGPQAAMYQIELARMYGQYQSNVWDSLESLTRLQTLQSELESWDPQTMTADDGLGKIFDFQGVLGPAEYRSVIYALDNAEGVHTIFAPKVTVMNNQRAEIKDVTAIRYNKAIEEAEDQNVDVGDAFSVIYEYAVTPQDWEVREYGTRLTVTPSIQRDNRTIELDVQPEISDLRTFRQFVSSRDNVYELPQFFVQSIRTRVTVDDGDTIVMGGLMTDQIIRTQDKTPILGDLPWVGRFWRGESEVAKKSNLLVFLNAKIMDPAGRSIRRGSGARQ